MEKKRYRVQFHLTPETEDEELLFQYFSSQKGKTRLFLRAFKEYLENHNIDYTNDISKADSEPSRLDIIEEKLNTLINLISSDKSSLAQNSSNKTINSEKAEDKKSLIDNPINKNNKITKKPKVNHANNEDFNKALQESLNKQKAAKQVSSNEDRVKKSENEISVDNINHLGDSPEKSDDSMDIFLSTLDF